MQDRARITCRRPAAIVVTKPKRNVNSFSRMILRHAPIAYWILGVAHAAPIAPFASSAGHPLMKSPPTFNFHKERLNAAEQVLNATSEALTTLQALTSEDATTCLDATLVEGIMGVFADRVSTMVAIEQAISPQTLHDVLRDCIRVTNDPDSSWSQVNAGEPSRWP